MESLGITGTPVMCHYGSMTVPSEIFTKIQYLVLCPYRYQLVRPLVMMLSHSPFSICRTNDIDTRKITNHHTHPQFTVPVAVHDLNDRTTTGSTPVQVYALKHVYLVSRQGDNTLLQYQVLLLQYYRYNSSRVP